MPQFRYKIKDAEDAIRQGLVQAASVEVAAETLVDQGWTVLSLEPEATGFLGKSLALFNRVSAKDLVVFSRQLSVIVSATVPLVQGLRMLVAQTTNPGFRQIISEVADDVEGGAKLSAAFSQHSTVFSSFYISIIRSGETSGKLDDVLSYLADQLEKDYDLSSKIRGAMIYPAFILGAMFTVGTLMMIVVIPELTAVLKETGAALPWSTRALIATSNFLTNYWPILLGVIVVGGVVGRMAVQTPQGRLFWDNLKLKLPIFGRLFQKIIIVRITRSLHTLLTGGVSLAKSLEIVSSVAGNVVYERIILETVKEVEDGNPIATAFSRHEEVPVMVSQMLNLGERTGRIDEILDKLSAFYNREVGNMVNNLVSLLEPFVMIMMGIGVGILVAAIILPLYNLAGAF